MTNRSPRLVRSIALGSAALIAAAGLTACSSSSGGSGSGSGDSGGSGDVGVKVGAGATAAAHRVGTPEDVTAVLDALADLVAAG